jgi:hypothetical protein
MSDIIHWTLLERLLVMKNITAFNLKTAEYLANLAEKDEMFADQAKQTLKNLHGKVRDAKAKNDEVSAEIERFLTYYHSLPPSVEPLVSNT